MTIEVQLPHEVESELNRRAELAGQDVSTYVAEAVRQMVGADHNGSEVSYQQWQGDFRAWVESHRSRNPDFDDSRESIYD
jgi:hypothetical protein